MVSLDNCRSDNDLGTRVYVHRLRPSFTPSFYYCQNRWLVRTRWYGQMVGSDHSRFQRFYFVCSITIFADYDSCLLFMGTFISFMGHPRTAELRRWSHRYERTPRNSHSNLHSQL